MKKSLLALALLAGCGGGDPDTGNRATAESSPSRTAVRTAGLTGLYQGGAAARPDQLCIIDKGAGNSRFGLIVWSEGVNSCAGDGQAIREGDRLRLQMQGDEACEIAARIEGDTVVMPAEIPSGCSYYCAAGASLANARLTRAGATAEDAMKAKDFAGDPLCG